MNPEELRKQREEIVILLDSGTLDDQSKADLSEHLRWIDTELNKEAPPLPTAGPPETISTPMPDTPVPPVPDMPPNTLVGKLTTDELKQLVTPGEHLKGLFTDLVTPPEEGTFLSKTTEGRALEAGGDLLNIVSVPFDIVGEILWEQLVGVPQTVKSLAGKGSPPAVSGLLEAHEKFAQRPWYEQLGIGALGGLLLTGAATSKTLATNASRQLGAIKSKPLPAVKSVEPVADILVKPKLTMEQNKRAMDLIGRLSRINKSFVNGRASTRGQNPLVNARNALRWADELESLGFRNVKNGLDPSLKAVVRGEMRDMAYAAYYEKIAAYLELTDDAAKRVATQGLLDDVARLKRLDIDAPLPLVKNPEGDFLLDVGGLFKALPASGDLSAPLRQGYFISSRHPKVAAQSFKAMMLAFKDERYATLMDDVIRQDPDFAFANAHKLEITSWRPGTPNLQREEQFISRFAAKFPGVRMSDRAFHTYLNHLRWNVYKNWLTEQRVAGKVVKDVDATEFARFINYTTGRGPVPDQAQLLTKVLNAGFMSPRLLTSRFAMPIQPFVALLKGASPQLVASEMFGSMVTGFGSMFTIIGLASLIPGVTVDWDTRSSDFMKIKVGPHRIDVGASYIPIMRLIARIATGERMTSSGNVVEASWQDEMLRFLTYKMAPLPGTIKGVWENKDAVGHKLGGAPYTPSGWAQDNGAPPEIVRALGAGEFVATQLLPWAWSSITEAIVVGGMLGGPAGAARGAAAGSTELLGTGVTTYQTPDEVATQTWGVQYPGPFERDMVRQGIGGAPEPDRLPSQYEALETDLKDQYVAITNTYKAGKVKTAWSLYNKYRRAEEDFQALSKNEFDNILERRIDTPEEEALQQWYDVLSAPAFHNEDGSSNELLQPALQALYTQWLSEGEAGQRKLEYVQRNTNRRPIPVEYYQAMMEINPERAKSVSDSERARMKYLHEVERRKGLPENSLYQEWENYFFMLDYTPSTK